MAGSFSEDLPLPPPPPPRPASCLSLGGGGDIDALPPPPPDLAWDTPASSHYHVSPVTSPEVTARPPLGSTTTQYYQGLPPRPLPPQSQAHLNQSPSHSLHQSPPCPSLHQSPPHPLHHHPPTPSRDQPRRSRSMITSSSSRPPQPP